MSALASHAKQQRVEFLIFTLGVNPKTKRAQRYGLSVFQVQEVLYTPTITRLPQSPEGVVGVVSLRGAVLPVLDLTVLLRIPAESSKDIMVVAEANGRLMGFLADEVDTIVRLDESELKAPPLMLQRSHLKAIAELEGGRLVQLLDLPEALEAWFPSQSEEWSAVSQAELPVA